MKFLVVAVGNRMPGWINAGFDEYARRMPRNAGIELVQIKPEKRGQGKSCARVLEKERDRINAAIPPGAHKIALDESGAGFTTRAFAAFLARAMQEGRDLAFIVGGADGLHADFKARADRLLALSGMTLPHGLARVLLAEQLYRAMSLISGHPYHRQ